MVHNDIEFEDYSLIPLAYALLPTLTPSNIKDAIVRKLGSVEPNDIVSIYTRTIDPMFPIISIARLQARLTRSWDECSLDLALLSLLIILLDTNPPLSPEDLNNPSDFRTLYLCAKSWISLTEGLGINSIEIVQARLLMTTFESAHGFYPAGYISIGAAIRAADALAVHPQIEASTTSHAYSGEEANLTDSISVWCFILVLDRYRFLFIA